MGLHIGQGVQEDLEPRPGQYEAGEDGFLVRVSRRDHRKKRKDRTATGESKEEAQEAIKGRSVKVAESLRRTVEESRIKSECNICS